MCPFNRSSCGSNNEIDFNSTASEKKTVNITLPTGETCTFKIKAKCGLPTFEPLNDTTGFDIQIVDYDEDDLDASNSARLLQALPPPQNNTNKTGDKKEDGERKPKEMKNKAANVTRVNGPKSDKEFKGPQLKTYNPDEGKKREFKGGAKLNQTSMCKNRYQQISVTYMGNLTGSARLLQSVSNSSSSSYQTLVFEASTTTTDGTSESSAHSLFVSLSFALFFAFATMF